jgi:hypothetical protein
MAFSGTPVIKLVSDGLVRLKADTGREGSFALAPGASGTIGLFEKTVAANVVLPEAFKPREYKNAEAADVSLQDSVQVEVVYAETGAVVQPVKVVKTGTMPHDFEITLTNTSNSETGDSGDLEIYIRFH